MCVCTPVIYSKVLSRIAREEPIVDEAIRAN